MPGNNAKYTPQFREETARYIIENGRSAASVAEEVGVDKNTVCSRVRAYRKQNGLPGYSEEKGTQDLRPKGISEEGRRIRELEKERWAML
ncbi:MAG: transposase [Lachnospiraceae bacterium]|nr:transposase [Lachnospiraceae bacterium]